MEFSSLAKAFELHLRREQLLTPATVGDRDRFGALALSLRDLNGEGWIATKQAYRTGQPNQVHYLSMEYLIGRSFRANLTNLRIEPRVRDMLSGSPIWTAFERSYRWRRMLRFGPRCTRSRAPPKLDSPHGSNRLAD